MKLEETDQVMNKNMDIEDKPIITLGNMKKEFMTTLYNTCISYPNNEIWLATADIEACFCWPLIHLYACGAFSFIMFLVSTAMVFRFAASANCWEPFELAI
jgi:hypothetical protein